MNGVRTRSVQVMRPSEPWGQTPMVFSWTANKTHNAQEVCRILVPPPNIGRRRAASDLGRLRDTPLQVLMPVAQEDNTLLEQVYYQFWIMREGWLVDPGTNWVWRFHRDDKAWVRDPKVFICLLYTSPSPRDKRQSRMPSSA